MKKPRVSALNPVIDGLDDTRGDKANSGGRQSSTAAFSRENKTNKKRRKLRKPSSSGSTGSNSSLSGISRASSGSEEYQNIHCSGEQDPTTPMSTSGIMGLQEGNNNNLEMGKV